MKLPNLPFGEKRKSDYFLALILQDEKVNSFIFEKVEQKISILGKSEEVLETPIDDLSYEELLDACDKVVSASEEQTQKDLGTLRTIFGLKQTWVSENKIKKEYIDKLQKVSKELELAPFGFLTITDAIVNLIQKEEGAPPSAILADIGDKFVTVSLIKAGKIVETKTSEIHQSPVFTVDTLLKHLTLPEILPSKVYFVGDEELTQEFIGHQWSKSLPFLHLPQISNLPESFIENAFVTGVAKEMKAEIVGESVEQGVEQESVEEGAPQTEFQKDEAEILKATEEGVGEEPKVQVVNDAGFFGFVEGKDVAKAEPKEFKEPEVPPAVEGEQIEEIPQEVKLSQTGNRLVPVILLAITFIKSFIGKLNFGVLKRIPIPAGVGGRKKILPLILGGLFLSLLIFYFFLLSAKVQILATPRVEELNQTIVFSTTGESNFDENIIAAETASVEISGTASTPATGKEETGEKAKGTVTVYNSSAQTATLSARTKLTRGETSFFTLSAISIPPRPGVGSLGSANVEVEAENFGTQYNLPSKIEFLSIGGNEDLDAINSNAFTGGTTKEVRVVSEDDFAKLEEDLIAKLTEEAKTQILNKVTGGKQILPEFISAEVNDANFDREEGDEASTVTLTGRVSFVGLLFERNDILDYAEKNLTPEDSSINKENLEISFENIEVLEEDEVQADLNIEARILPEVNRDEIAQRIARKSFSEASEIILSIPNIAGVEISFSPNIPFLPKILPGASKIRIEIVDNG